MIPPGGVKRKKKKKLLQQEELRLHFHHGNSADSLDKLMFGVDSNLHLYHGRYMKHLLYTKCQGGCRTLTARQDWLRGPNSALPHPQTDTMVSSAHQAVYHQGSVCEEEGALLIHAETLRVKMPSMVYPV